MEPEVARQVIGRITYDIQSLRHMDVEESLLEGLEELIEYIEVTHLGKL